MPQRTEQRIAAHSGPLLIYLPPTCSKNTNMTVLPVANLFFFLTAEYVRQGFFWE